MRTATAIGLLVFAAPALAGYADAAAQLPLAPAAAHVRVTTRMVVVDRDAVTRAGLAYVVLGNDRVRVSSSGRRAPRGAGVQLGTLGVSAFLEAVRDSRWIRSESTQQVLTLSGAEALVSSGTLTLTRHAAHTRGPSLAVIPTVLDDGRVHMLVSARLEEAVTGWGYGADGSPAAVATEVIAREGEEVILASGSAVETTRASGILRWGSSRQERDVLVVVSVQVIRN